MRRTSLWSKLMVVLLIAGGAQGALLYHYRSSRPSPVVVGDRLPGLHAYAAASATTIDFKKLERCTHVLFIIPTCDMCERLAPRWAEEFASAHAPSTLVVSFSSWEAADRFVTRHGIPAPMYASGADEAVAASLKLGVMTVPTLAVLGKRGRIAALAEGPDYTLAEIAAEAGCTDA